MQDNSNVRETAISCPRLKWSDMDSLSMCCVFERCKCIFTLIIEGGAHRSSYYLGYKRFKVLSHLTYVVVLLRWYTWILQPVIGTIAAFGQQH